jgi:molybdopterin/thiamine biosynthesis adenylyltransferase
MKPTAITIGLSDWTALRGSLFIGDSNENAAVLLCGVAETESLRRLLVRRMVSVPAELYLERHFNHLEVAPAFYNAIVTKCLAEHLTPVIVHSHPGHQDAWYSTSDDHGEKRLLDVLGMLLPGKQPASLVLSEAAATGRILVNGVFQPLSGLRIISTPTVALQFERTENEPGTRDADRFDRQIRAFGADGQRALESTRVAIIGVGGIGSVVAEQLVRAGIRDLLLIDGDTIEESNLSRIFGSTPTDVGANKVDVIARHLQAIGAPTIKKFRSSAIRQSVLLNLRDRDLIFSCVDNDRTRAILNRFSHQYLVPVIDHGTRLDAREGQITAAAGRVTLVGMEFACLRCSHHINSERIRAESMSPGERSALRKEGYLIGIDEPAPAVVSINAVIGGLGATAGLNLIVNLTGGPQPIDQIYDARSGSVFPVAPTHERGCDVCGEQEGVKGLGDFQIVSAYK